jgi:hypothetical protein
LHSEPAAAPASLARGLHEASLREWESRFAGAVEVVCAAGEAFASFFRVQDHKFPILAEWACTDYPFFQSGLLYRLT